MKKKEKKLCKRSIPAIESFCEAHSIELMVLFGSRTQRMERPDSDMDIAVKMIKRVGTDRLGLIVGLERLFQKPVDLVILSPTTDPLLLNEIFTDGEPLYQREIDIFYRWKTFAWHCYMDTQWIRDMQWEWIQRKTSEAA